MQVEAVAWISQRKTLLAAFFFLLALHAWLGANEAEGARGRRLYLASLAAFILALLAKVSAIVLPAVLLLHTLCYPREGRTRSFRAIVPFVVPSIFMGLGVFVSFMQAFIFTVLSMIYISGAVTHAEEH